MTACHETTTDLGTFRSLAPSRPRNRQEYAESHPFGRGSMLSRAPHTANNDVGSVHVTAIDSAEIHDWYRRLAGIGADPEPGSPDAPTTPLPIRFRGAGGLSGYSGHARATSTDAVNPAHFDCVLLQTNVGALELTGRLVTPSTVVRTECDAGVDEESIVFALSTLGVARWITPSRSGLLIPGRMLAVPSMQALRTDTLELADETTLRVPLGRLGTHGDDLLTMPSLLLPDTALTRAVGMYLTRLLFELSCGPELDHETAAALEAATLELISAVIAQLHRRDDDLENRRLRVRGAVTRLIEADHCESAFNVDAIAHALHMSKRQLYRYFGDDEDGIAGVLVRRRLHTARELLADRPDLTVTQVATRSGFGDVGTLRARFRREFAVSPSQFREQYFAAERETNQARA